MWDMGMTKKVPSLMLDTEMTSDFHRMILLSRESGIPRSDIEQGVWGNNPDSEIKVQKAAAKLKESPIFYKSAAGLTMSEVLVLIREFIHRYVGLKENGLAKDCVIIYDFLHLTNLKGLSNHIREHQVLGNYLVMLRTLAIQYNIPIVLVVQLNREGREEDYGTVSGTDRVEWFCTSLTILRKKTFAEIERDGGADQGNVKAKVVYSRYGEGHNEEDYLNLIINYPVGKISEGRSYQQLAAERRLTSKDESSDTDKDSEKKPRKRGRRKKDEDGTSGS